MKKVIAFFSIFFCMCISAWGAERSVEDFSLLKAYDVTWYDWTVRDGVVDTFGENNTVFIQYAQPYFVADRNVFHLSFADTRKACLNTIATLVGKSAFVNNIQRHTDLCTNVAVATYQQVTKINKDDLKRLDEREVQKSDMERVALYRCWDGREMITVNQGHKYPYDRTQSTVDCDIDKKICVSNHFYDGGNLADRIESFCCNVAPTDNLREYLSMGGKVSFIEQLKSSNWDVGWNGGMYIIKKLKADEFDDNCQPIRNIIGIE